MRTFLLTALIAIVSALGVWAGEIDMPETIYTESELGQRLMRGEEVGFNELYYAHDDGIALFSESYANSTQYYDQLTPYEKEFYSFYAENIDSCKDGVTTLSKSFKIPLDGVDTSSGDILTDINEVLGVSLTSTFLQRPLYTYLYLDHPEKFWMDVNRVSFSFKDGTIYSDGTNALFTVIIKVRSNSSVSYDNYRPACYTSQTQLEADIENMNTKIDEILALVPDNASDFQKVCIFSDWLCDNAEYNPDIKLGSRYMYIAPSAFLYGLDEDTTKRPVCEGYSEAFKILCDRAGVRCMCVESSTHKWNIVQIGDSFYHVDPTWNDSASSKEATRIAEYGYLLIGSSKMAQLDSTTDHSIKYQTDVAAPLLSEKSFLENSSLPQYDGLTIVKEPYIYSSSKPLFSYNYLDIDQNGRIEYTDAVSLLRQAAAIDELKGHDMDESGTTDLADVIRLWKLFFN